MLPTDRTFSEAIERAVGEIEAKTDAEVVVVTAPRSGSYADLAALGAGACAWVVLAFLIWSPILFDDWAFPVEVLGAGAIAWWGLRRDPRLARFARPARRRQQVREAALAAFTQENVHATVGRTGVLVYISVAEGLVEIVPDHGLLGRIPGAIWNNLVIDGRTLEGVVSGLRTLGDLLATHVPVTPGDRDELPNAPVVRA